MTEFNLETALQNQETNEGKVQNEAVTKAKENIANLKLQEETRKVEIRLADAERIETDALKRLRLARKKEEAQKVYLTSISKAKIEFESSGDYRAYDKAVSEAEELRETTVRNAKFAIYGEDGWRY